MPNKQNDYTRSFSDILKANQIDQFDFFDDSFEETQFKIIPVDKIQVDELHQSKYISKDELEKVVSSIKEFGVVTPIIVRKNEDDSYDLITGIKRLTAAKELNIQQIPSVILNIKKEQMIMVLIDETINSDNSNPLEKAYTYQYMAKVLRLTQSEIAIKVNKSRPYITNHLRLLLLPNSIKRLIIAGKISFGQARPLISLPSNDAISLANQIVKEKLSAREVEDRCAEILHNSSDSNTNTIKKLSTKYDCNVTIRKNKLIFETKDSNHLSKLLEILLDDGGNDHAD